MDAQRFDPRTLQELLADAERYERWAGRTTFNPKISEKFARLAADARARVER